MQSKNLGRWGLIALLVGASSLTGASSIAKQQQKHEHGKDVVVTLVDRGDCKIFVTALKESGIAKTLAGKGPYTIFAPNDIAVREWQVKVKSDKNWPSNEQFAKQLKYHIIPRKIVAADIKSDGSLKTLAGDSVMTQVKDGTTWIDGSKVLQADIPCSNGELFVIDTMLVPERGK